MNINLEKTRSPRGHLRFRGGAKIISWLGLVWLFAFPAHVEANTNSAEVVIDESRAGAELDLTRFALGQGGLSDQPMFDVHVAQIAQLRPQTIRVFIQEFFNLYPERGRYHWETFDRFIETILATGAKPILSLCFKPKVLFPKVDQRRAYLSSSSFSSFFFSSPKVSTYLPPFSSFFFSITKTESPNGA